MEKMRVGGENGAIQVGCLYKVARKDDFSGSTRMAMRTGSSTLNYLLGDHLRSTAITTNSGGVIDSEIRYYPWGTERYSSGTTPTSFR